ncbi:hypothetical protein [Micromonospora sp. WMMA1947]|uniref:hypothetical protein n=1 Tax=Micromonospora sp. WMMA1947 TaxID=3015163 RepID=UPI00248D360E|nr:hypothetical protein [Micromonospora sp. WMMA1947]WBC06770.1 hypothetical protein O7604_16090 [Micromonospora sp. WMMA1947]
MSRKLWGDGEQFLMLSIDMCEELAANVAVRPLYVRLVFAAYARVNDIGHAEFEPGEMLHVLGDVDHDRVLTPASRQTLYSALQQAEAFGMVLPGSGLRCVLLPVGVRRGGTGRDCHWHKVGLDRRRRRVRRPAV